MSRKTIFLLILSVLFVAATPKAHASFFDDILNSLQGFVTPPPPKIFSIDSKIALAPNGDANKNGKIDTGDTIRFIYTINNPTNTSYPRATLRTNINRPQLNFIHNVQGTTGIDDQDKIISFPNFSIASQATLIVGFDARIIDSATVDRIITTEPELITKEKKSVFKASKKSITAKKHTSELIQSLSKKKLP